MKVLVTGGVRSGKSRHAESLLAAEPAVTHVAPPAGPPWRPTTSRSCSSPTWSASASSPSIAPAACSATCWAWSTSGSPPAATSSTWTSPQSFSRSSLAIVHARSLQNDAGSVPMVHRGPRHRGHPLALTERSNKPQFDGTFRQGRRRISPRTGADRCAWQVESVASAHAWTVGSAARTMEARALIGMMSTRPSYPRAGLARRNPKTAPVTRRGAARSMRRARSIERWVSRGSAGRSSPSGTRTPCHGVTTSSA